MIRVEKRDFFAVLLLLTVCSCVSEIDKKASIASDASTIKTFYASIECSEPDTKVFADANMKVLWNADDRLTIFNQSTYNYQYRFTGDDGDNAGGFEEIPASGFISGNSLNNVYAVYPYSTDNKINNAGTTITLTLPAEQAYKEHSFGVGANTMIAATNNNFLAFKNVGGYLSLRLYGDNVSVSRITLQGNNHEKIAGKAEIAVGVGTLSSVTMTNEAAETISIVCDPAVKIGTSSSDYTDFWFVIPPVTFTKGFTVTVTDSFGGTFEVSTSKSFTISRSTVEWMSPLKVVPNYDNVAIVFADANVKAVCVANWDTNGDGELSYAEAAAVTELGGAFSNNDEIEYFGEFKYFVGIKSMGALSGDGTGDNPNGFSLCSKLKTICLPPSLTDIGGSAFYYCENLQEVEIPVDIKRIWYNPFIGCKNLTTFIDSKGNKSRLLFSKNENSRTLCSVATGGLISLEIQTAYGAPGYNVTWIGGGALYDCYEGLTNVTVYIDALKTVGCNAFAGNENMNVSFQTENEYATTLLNSLDKYAFAHTGITTFSIPEGVTVGRGCFAYCEKLSSLYLSDQSSIPEDLCYDCKSLNRMWIPASVKTIENNAFSYCTSIGDFYVASTTPPTINGNPFSNTSCTFKVPSSAVATYKEHAKWSTYATRIVGY